MSTTETRTEEHRPGRNRTSPQARSNGHPRLGRRPRQGVLRAPRLEARRRLRLRQRLSGRPVHSARLGSVGSVRNEDHDRHARLGPGATYRHRHRSCSRRARCPRGGCQRGVPPRTAGRSVPARRHKHPAERASRRSRQLQQLVRHVQRPRRQRLAAAGDHAASPRPHRPV